MKTLLVSTLVMIAAPAFSSVAGSAYGDHVGLDGHAWVEYLNDDFKPSSPDDYMTAGARAGVVVDRVGLGADYRILTMRKAHTRADQFSTTASYDFAKREDLVLAVGVGVIAIGDLGGSKVQNSWHRDTHERQVGLTYDSGHYTSPLVVVDARKSWDVAENTRVAVDGSGSAHRIGGDLEARVLLEYHNDDFGSEFVAWIGPGILGHYGQAVTPTELNVNRRYSGVSINAGLKLDHVILSFQAANNIGFGAVGVEF